MVIAPPVGDRTDLLSLQVLALLSNNLQECILISISLAFSSPLKECIETNLR